MHTVSTEAYVVTAGSGSLQTLDRTGYRRARRSRRARSCGSRRARSTASSTAAASRSSSIMSNRGLPEAGDAVMTFDDEVLADAERYGEAARLPDAAADRPAAAQAARARRDAAVQGFLALRAAAAGRRPRTARALLRPRRGPRRPAHRRVGRGCAKRACSPTPAAATSCWPRSPPDPLRCSARPNPARPPARTATAASACAASSAPTTSADRSAPPARNFSCRTFREPGKVRN